ncbi:Na+/H+ antiporter NhaC family protein [Blastopirellula retiformator]|uniref:Na+/H+ antiporter NhaC family protein n=1 Tax=Blastopirellula retiformator TaxID=2527970 RepID=UPI001C95C87F|nr:Na+/H+ antiporter NhaC family protein [Blastopirellula retiformator]
MHQPTPETSRDHGSLTVDETSPPTASSPWSRYAFFALIAIVLVWALIIGRIVQPAWSVQKVAIEPTDELIATEVITFDESGLTPTVLQQHADQGTAPAETSVVVVEDAAADSPSYFQVTATSHFGIWSLFPAAVAIASCWILREPLTSLLLGTVSGALILRQYDFTEEVLLPSLASTQAAGILILYLWLLGGLMGVWGKTGTAEAFSVWVTKRFVRGPRSAKLVAWGLGVLFFQGGTVSTVLVGAAVRPIADQQRISHEELSYIVDSTASPIACLVAFNAWPSYVQALIFIPGVTFLATEQERIRFFFSALPFSFYAIFAVLGTLLLSIDRAPVLGKKFRAAIRRARENNQLNRPGSHPLSLAGQTHPKLPPGYQPHVIDFCLPLMLLTGIAIVSFFVTGAPQVRWGFAAALACASATALLRGMPLRDLVEGIGEGLQSVVYASVILMLAVTLGDMTQNIGGGAYLVDLLGSYVPSLWLPTLLFLITIAISFSTGTSWGTFAVAFPLAMPLAMSVAQTQGLSNETLYLMVCFAAVLNGSVFGDQCSPISDTTVLSAMTTGADLMDHVTTQMVPATFAAVLAVIGWTSVTYFFC